MADVDDPRNAHGRYRRELEKIDEAADESTIADSDRDAIVAFADHKKRDNGSVGTVATYLNRLRTSAERAPKPLVAFDGVEDVDALLEAHTDAGISTDSTLNNHLSALRQFFGWLGDVEPHGHDDYGFRADVENRTPDDESDEGEESEFEHALSTTEVVRLRDAATHPREEAFVAFLADTGRPLADVCQMRCGEVILDPGSSGAFRPARNSRDTGPDSDNEYSLHRSRPSLRRWLENHHPESPDPPDDAPLFPVKRGYDSKHCEECALSPSAAEDALKRVAEDAAIDSDRIRPRNWRYTAVLRMRGHYDMDWDAIGERAGWGDESLARLKAAYRGLKEEDRFATREHTSGNRAAVVADAVELGSAADTCIEFGTEVPPSGRFCQHCGTEQSFVASPSPGASPIERQLQRQREQITLLTRLTRVISDVNEVLVTAGGRTAILEGVTERLTSSALYDGAWATEEALTGGAVARNSGSGGDFGGATVVEGSLADNDGIPTGRDSQTTLPVGSEAIGHDEVPEVDGRWTSVPIVHGRTVYGTLVLFSSREKAFDERELAVLDDLGRQVGHAVNAAEKELLLVSDTAIELQFRAQGEDPLAVASSAVGGGLRVDSVVPTGGDEVIVYCTVEGDVQEAVAALSRVDGVVRLRPIDDSNVECWLGEGTLVVPLREVGAQIEEVVAQGGECTVVARVSPEADVRTIVDRIQRSVPGVELQAKRRREGGSEQSRSGLLLSTVSEQLTDRQQETLEAAYEGGYFDWPRESTAEDIAEELGIASSTMHSHLRRAENEVLGELLEE